MKICSAMVVVLGVSALTSCSHYRSENQPLYQYSGVEQQIENYYNSNATEKDWECDQVQMGSIDKTKIVNQTSTQVRMAVTYYFNSFDLSPRQGGDQCQGFNTRIFTFDKGPGNQLTAVSMSGAQRGGGA
jgi:hypothetical protein